MALDWLQDAAFEAKRARNAAGAPPSGCFVACLAFLDAMRGVPMFSSDPKTTLSAAQAQALCQAVWALTPRLLTRLVEVLASKAAHISGWVSVPSVQGALIARLHKVVAKPHGSTAVASILLNTDLAACPTGLNLFHVLAQVVNSGKRPLAIKLAAQSKDASLQGFLVNLVAGLGETKAALKLVHSFNLPVAAFEGLAASRVFSHLKWLCSKPFVHDSLIDGFMRAHPGLAVELCSGLLQSHGAGSRRVRKYCTLLGVPLPGVRLLSPVEVAQSAATTPRAPSQALKLPARVKVRVVCTAGELLALHRHPALTRSKYIAFQSFWVPNVPAAQQRPSQARVPGAWGTPPPPPREQSSDPPAPAATLPLQQPPGLPRVAGMRHHTSAHGGLLNVCRTSPVQICCLALATPTHVFLLDIVLLSGVVGDQDLNEALGAIFNPSQPCSLSRHAARQASTAQPVDSEQSGQGLEDVVGVSAVSFTQPELGAPSDMCLAAESETFVVPAADCGTSPIAESPSSLHSPATLASPLTWGDTVWTPTRTPLASPMWHLPTTSQGNGKHVLQALQEGPAKQRGELKQRHVKQRTATCPRMLTFNVRREFAHWAASLPQVTALSCAGMPGGVVDLSAAVLSSLRGAALGPGAWPSLAEVADMFYTAPMDRTVQVSDWHRRPLMPEQVHFMALYTFTLVDMTLKVDERWGSRQWQRLHPAKTRAIAAQRWSKWPSENQTLCFKKQDIGRPYTQPSPEELKQLQADGQAGPAALPQKPEQGPQRGKAQGGGRQRGQEQNARGKAGALQASPIPAAAPAPPAGTYAAALVAPTL